MQKMLGFFFFFCPRMKTRIITLNAEWYMPQAKIKEKEEDMAELLSQGYLYPSVNFLFLFRTYRDT